HLHLAPSRARPPERARSARRARLAPPRRSLRAHAHADRAARAVMRRARPEPVATVAAVSSLATAPERHAPGDPGAARAAASGRRPTRDGMPALALAAVLTTIVFVTTGGTELGPNTWTEIVLTLTGLGFAVAVLVLGAP